MPIKRRKVPLLVAQLVLLCRIKDSLSFSLGNQRFPPRRQPVNQLDGNSDEDVLDKMKVTNQHATMAALTAAAILVGSVVSPAWADELGRETEAPTFSTGENVYICTKRGPLGACLKTELRTAENENDVSEKYFRQPTELVKRKDDAARMAEVTEGNALIERLKQQTEDNREKNELLVKQRTMMNDSSASFGPFDAQVLILNEDGKGFTLLANPQAMRLKKAGFISDDRKFIKQPTQEQLDDALEPEIGGGFLDRILGGS
ncbi:hypothetical protein IV203_031789 [Nitzschia inconspicua]|uniref:Uncharacterized protein n=1 Tax=Nitzschia inconspicua TaxID=303405 RepID=A0A9K3LYQ6_9STRA|nr:hypothetical protein IV203_031789 [Nitzschia inconspicua]